MNDRRTEIRKGIIPLSRAEEGATLRIVSVDCGRGLFARLRSMGLRIGVDFKLLKCAGPGPLVLAVGNGRLALGRGMADKITVERVHSD
ncbi:MAG: FeoA family protein [Planctomycetota bacterium]